MIVMIDYFGWPIGAKQLDRTRGRGAWLVEDATQAMLSDGAGSTGGFAVVNPRKFLGVPDGGILIPNRTLGCSALD